VWRRIASILLGITILCFIGLAFLYLVGHAAHFLVSLDQPLVVAILAASATILASTITVVLGKIFERKKEIEAHFRERKFEHFFEMLTLMHELTQRTVPVAVDDAVVKRLSDWQRNLILFAGPKTIRSFVAWFGNLTSGNLTVRTIMLMEEFYKSLRADLGISNLGLNDGDLARLLLRHGDLYVAMSKKNPNLPLAALIEMEKKIEAATVRTDNADKA
jgi:membrane protein YqaA with SNARE-associated domain